jgi:hypothetical protein
LGARLEIYRTGVWRRQTEVRDPHQIDTWYAHLRKPKSYDEAGRAVKTWRSLWAILAAQNLCSKDADPYAAIRKKSQSRRTQIWSEVEIVRLVKQACRERYFGLACVIAIDWDTQFSPVDVRQLTAGQMQTNGTEIAFALSREKTDKSAFGILSARTHALVEHYLKTRHALISETEPLFLSKGYSVTAKGRVTSGPGAIHQRQPQRRPRQNSRGRIR